MYYSKPYEYALNTTVSYKGGTLPTSFLTTRRQCPYRMNKHSSGIYFQMLASFLSIDAKSEVLYLYGLSRAPTPRGYPENYPVIQL